jgi:hypothetical protein
MKFLNIFLLIIALFTFSGCGIQSVQTGVDNKDDAEQSFQDDETVLQEEKEVDFFIAVHLDPVMAVGEQDTTLRPDRYWKSVVDTVAAADEYGQKLSLLMNPQWGSYLLENQVLLNLAREWEVGGHELGMHYHGPEMSTKWSGYSNQLRFFPDPNFQGTTADAMIIMNQIPADGQIKTCTVNDADAPYEFPEGVVYSTDGGLYGYEDLISTPESLRLNGQEVLQVLHAKYGEGGKDAVTLEEIKQAIDGVEEGEVIGIVFHDKAFGNDPTDILELFDYLEEIELETKSVKEILAAY